MTPSEIVTTHFYLWEILGRGWLIYPNNVDLEPAFSPLRKDMVEVSVIQQYYQDTERVETELVWAIKFAIKLSRQFYLWFRTEVLKKPIHHNQKELLRINQKKDTNIQFPPYHKQNPFAQPDYGKWIDMDILLPDKMGVSLHHSKELLRYIASSNIPVSYEIIAKGGEISLRLSTPKTHSIWLQNHIELLFPNIVVRPSQQTLKEHIYTNYSMNTLSAIDFGYTNEWMLPARTPVQKEPETLLSIMSLIDGLEIGDTVIFQVMCQGVVSPWQFAMIDAVTSADGKPFFINAPELAKGAEIKSSEPFLTATVRVLIQCMDSTRISMIIEAVEQAIYQATNATGLKGILGSQANNYLGLLEPKGYQLIDHMNDICNRSSRRTGMLMSVSELVTLFHFPPPSVRSKKLVFNATNSVPVPSDLKSHATILGINSYLGKDADVSVSTEHRLRHMHVVGATGSGKSTFLLHLMQQDIQNGNGFAILDPHGDTIEAIISHIPKERISDVVLIDPSDSEYAFC